MLMSSASLLAPFIGLILGSSQVMVVDSEVQDASKGEIAETSGDPSADIRVASRLAGIGMDGQNGGRDLATSDLSVIGTTVVVTPQLSSTNLSAIPSVTNIKLLEDKVQDTACHAVESYHTSNAVVQKFQPFDGAKAAVYRYRRQQGVNLGSWFVHEQWMTPSLFTCASGKRASELDIASGWSSIASARAVLERHWDTFVTEADFAYLASIGINTVRIPVGYWSLGPVYCQQTPFEPVAAVYENSWAHVVKAINMAADAGIGVLIDLHGAVGSQNGQTHSGISDGKTNLFSNSLFQDKTIAVLSFLTKQLSSVTNIVGIQILNEPQNVPELTNFYTHVLEILRSISPEAAKMPFYIHDGFDLRRFHDYVSSRTDFVVQDHHSYFVFTPQDDAKSAADHTNDIVGSIDQSLANASQKQRNNLVIDEWSCALTANSLSKEGDQASAQRHFCESQLEVYRKSTAGWTFWNYNKEGCENDGGWCFRQALKQHLPLTFFSYPRGGSYTKNSHAAMSALRAISLPQNSTILQKFPKDKPRSSNVSSRENLIEFSLADDSLFPRQDRRDHRFAKVHARRQLQAAYSSPAALSPSHQAVIKGYTDGFLAAKEFALHGLSKLGFLGQYIEDGLRILGPQIQHANYNHYRDGFRVGLADAEDLVRNIVSA